MLRLFNFILFLMWANGILCKRVSHSPRFTDVKIKQTYVAWPVNTPLSLKCKADGKGPLTVNWYKNGRPIEPTENVFQDHKWNLKLRKPKLSDNGVYTCVVSNDFGSIKHNYSLRILERLQQTVPVLVPGYPKPVTARVGDSVELECLEQPNPKTTHYEWLKTDSLDDIVGLYEKGRGKLSPMKYKPYTVDGDKARFNGVKLQLKHITMEDQGFYTCFLSNGDGMTHGSAFLNVTPISRTDPPEFLIPKHRRKHFIASVENEDVTFSCLVRGGAPLKYQWLYNGKPLKSSEKHEIRESELLVRHVLRADDGVYTCKVKNGFGRIKHNFKLKVLARQPLFPSHPVLLPGYPKDNRAMVGDSVALFCADTSDTLVDYRWLKWDKSVKGFTKKDLLNASQFTIVHPKYHGHPPPNRRGVYLRLENLTMEDEGLYTCLVTSSFMGYAYRSAFLKVQPAVEKTFDQTISVAFSKEVQSTSTTTEASTTRPAKSRRCFNDIEEFDITTQCETTGSCAALSSQQTGKEKLFCDQQGLCSEHNVTTGECKEIKFVGVLCCCDGDLCNRRVIKLFQKTKKSHENSSEKSRLTPVLLFSTIVVIISVMLALLGYRMRQRKAALKESIVHTTKPNSRKITKKKVMETRWLKEDI